MNKPELV